MNSSFDFRNSDEIIRGLLRSRLELAPLSSSLSSWDPYWNETIYVSLVKRETVEQQQQQHTTTKSQQPTRQKPWSDYWVQFSCLGGDSAPKFLLQSDHFWSDYIYMYSEVRHFSGVGVVGLFDLTSDPQKFWSQKNQHHFFCDCDPEKKYSQKKATI
jgi:hypothetical protein